MTVSLLIQVTHVYSNARSATGLINHEAKLVSLFSLFKKPWPSGQAGPSEIPASDRRITSANMELSTLPVLLLLLPAAIAGNPYPDCVNGPLASNLVCDTSANFLDRAKALVNEMTLEEMVNNTVNGSPGVPRLGLPPYEWWSEALVSFFLVNLSI